ncbi:YbjQ family protein [Flavobacterium frigidarium]|uniref:YbjQ family protein n=1 Tax=Flavobacterium frigidarium TaxID=99286 RepID=UPI000425A63C|nr:heavy metal-binding domain-containing protein [Flavobacterium frigidarium]
MANLKDILVLTTSNTQGLTIVKHLKPVSAHLVAGTNIFSDFLGGLTDVFGGRSNSYQKQLSSLYDEAIELIKFNTYEIGGNCIIGLSIDMDEISGKGKSMFMLTAIGTAVIIQDEDKKLENSKANEKLENVGVERINNLRIKLLIIDQAKNNSLVLDDKTWNYIKLNQVEEVFPYIIDANSSLIKNYDTAMDGYKSFSENFISYLNALSENKQIELLYTAIENESDQKVTEYLVKVVQELNLFNFERTLTLLNNTALEKKKIGLKIATFDKSFYNKTDIENLYLIKEFISNNFKQRGQITSKKQLLSSKEKEVWNCECGNNSVEIGKYCGVCFNDIVGFKKGEVRAIDVEDLLDQKITLINNFLR